MAVNVPETKAFVAEIVSISDIETLAAEPFGHDLIGRLRPIESQFQHAGRVAREFIGLPVEALGESALSGFYNCVRDLRASMLALRSAGAATADGNVFQERIAHFESYLKSVESIRYWIPYLQSLALN